jgi:hypothetical protein
LGDSDEKMVLDWLEETVCKSLNARRRENRICKKDTQESYRERLLLNKKRSVTLPTAKLPNLAAPW